MSSLMQVRLDMLNEVKKRPLERKNTLDGLLTEIQFGLNRRNSFCDSDTGNSSAGELASSLTSCLLPDVVQRTTYTKQTLLTKGVDTKMKFSVDPLPGDSGFSQWCAAMQMVSRLPGGIPIEFRKRLWLTLADKHVLSKRIDWKKTKYICLNEKMNPDDDKLGVQIVKDLHRTGCSMFSGEETEHNQALLKKVLLAYARWNKVVGYCQGFNMLAAIILEVMEWNEENALKVMIYLIEEVLPEGYFANHMRGLSVDMAVFRELLKMRFPVLSQHLDRLQFEAQDSGAGTSYEPPLTNVFTMQWFLTLFSNCLPKSTVLRVWDLIFLEGNEVLLRTALSIWGGLADRVLTVESADEFYSIMGVLTREMLEFGIMDANDLVKTICSMTPLSPSELNDMRDKYAYNIRPLTSPFSSFKKNLKLLYSDDEDECDDDNLAMATWCLSNTMQMPKSKGGPMGFGDISPGAVGHGYSGNHPTPSANNVDAERMSLDISALKKQYAKLRERQKQAHVILTGAFANNTFSRQRLPVAVNHLLVGKKPLVRKNKPTSKITFEFKSATGTKLPSGESSTYHSAETKKPTVQITREGGKTLSWAEVKKEREKVKRQSSNNNEDDDEEELKEPNEARVIVRDLSESSSSCSSSSTELCDNVDMDDEDDDENHLSTIVDLSPEMGKKYSTYLEEPLTSIKVSSSYEADEDSISESISSSTLIPSCNIPSPGSNSTLGDDQLVSSSNSLGLEDITSYLGNYRQSLDTSPLSTDLDSDVKFDTKSYLANYRLSQDFSPDKSNKSSDSSDDNLSPGSLLSKLRTEQTQFGKSPEEEEEYDQLDTMSFLQKIGISREISPKCTGNYSPTSKSPSTTEKYGLSSYLAKYKQPESLESSPDETKSELEKNSLTLVDYQNKFSRTDDKIEEKIQSPVDESPLDSSKYLNQFSLQDSFSSQLDDKENKSDIPSFVSSYSTTEESTEDKYGLSKYLTDYSTCEKFTASPRSPEDEDLGVKKAIIEKKQSPKTPNSGDSSSPYDSGSDPPLSSPDITSPELEGSNQATASILTLEGSSSYSTSRKEESSNGTTSHSFNPFPTVKKIGYIANATAKLGLYAEKEFGLKENNPARNNSFKQKFQFTKTLK